MTWNSDADVAPINDPLLCQAALGTKQIDAQSNGVVILAVFAVTEIREDNNKQFHSC